MMLCCIFWKGRLYNEKRKIKNEVIALFNLQNKCNIMKYSDYFSSTTWRIVATQYKAGLDHNSSVFLKHQNT